MQLLRKTAIRFLRSSNCWQRKVISTEQMMYNTFNMGLGMVVAVDPADVDKTMEAIKAAGDTAICGRTYRSRRKRSYIMLRVAGDGIRRRNQSAGDHGCCCSQERSQIPKIVGVISNNQNAYALDAWQKSRDSGRVHFSEGVMRSRAEFNEELLDSS